jgi:hypothetical protein
MLFSQPHKPNYSLAIGQAKIEQDHIGWQTSLQHFQRLGQASGMRHADVHQRSLTREEQFQAAAK